LGDEFERRGVKWNFAKEEQEINLCNSQQFPAFTAETFFPRKIQQADSSRFEKPTCALRLMEPRGQTLHRIKGKFSRSVIRSGTNIYRSPAYGRAWNSNNILNYISATRVERITSARRIFYGLIFMGLLSSTLWKLDVQSAGNVVRCEIDRKEERGNVSRRRLDTLCGGCSAKRSTD